MRLEHPRVASDRVRQHNYNSSLKLGISTDTFFAMKIFAIAFLSIGLVCLVSLTHGKVEQYKMAVEENGTRYQEDIDIDEDDDVEVFRVPGHNDVEAADFYHDFKMGVTVTRVLSRKACHISKLDPSLSSPKKLKADLALVASRGWDIPTVTDSTVEVITGPANRLLLTKEILDFCGALPIYNTEHTKVDLSRGNESAIIHSRRKRQLTITATQRSCLVDLGRELLEYVTEGNCLHRGAEWNLSCKLLLHYSSCFHYVTCTNQFPDRASWVCSSVHRSSHSPICCDFICP